MTRAVASLLALAAALVACGHYGPPIRASRAKSEATAAAASAPAAAQPTPEEEQQKNE